MSATKDFFVSYTSTDREWAEWIAWTLEQGGYSCVLQAWDFVPGQDFMHQMRQALDSSRQLVAVVSEEYLQSAYAGAELNAALVKDPLGTTGALVPVRVRECALGGILKGRIHIDLVHRGPEQASRELLQGIAAARLGRRADPAEGRFKQPPKYPGGGVAVHDSGTSGTRDLPGVISILYLGSDTGAGLDLRGQAAQIASVLSHSRFGSRFRLDAIFDVTTENIFEVLNAHQPAVVHFAGKQNGGNVLIRTASGSVTTVSDVALAGLLQSLDSGVILAVVDTCKSLRCARAVTEVVDFAIGVENDIFDEDAIRFYSVFYRAIASGRSVASAYGQAKAALTFKQVPAPGIPQLCTREGLDAKRYQLVGA